MKSSTTLHLKQIIWKMLIIFLVPQYCGQNLSFGQNMNRPIQLHEIFRDTMSTIPPSWQTQELLPQPQLRPQLQPQPQLQVQQPQLQQFQWNSPELTQKNEPQQSPIAFPAPLLPTAERVDAHVQAITSIEQTPTDVPFDENVSDAIALSVLRFGHDIAKLLSEHIEAGSVGKSEVFSPLSVLSCLALVMVGSSGVSYQELQRLFNLGSSSNDLLLRSLDSSRFHQELGAMLDDIQMSVSGRHRHMAKWRYTQAGYSIRQKSNDSQRPIEHIIRLANGVFTQNGYNLNPSYRIVVRSVYHSAFQSLDFDSQPSQSADYINSWVSNATFHKIPKIISSDISKGTNVILASALYFKGFWENSFFETATMTDKFYPDGVNGPFVNVQMMATGGIFPFYDAQAYDCRIIGLPYKGNFTTMYVIQPNQSSKLKLYELQKRLSAEAIDEMIERMEQKTAVVAFPKMHLMRTLNMKSMLKRLGLHEIFSSSLSDLSLVGNLTSHPYEDSSILTSTPKMNHFGSRQNLHEGWIVSRFHDVGEDLQNTALPGIKGGRRNRLSRQARLPLYNRRNQALNELERQRQSLTSQSNYRKSDLFVEDVLHKVDFEVNEHGTEAAAATLTYLRRSGTDVLFRADTPFILLVRHDPTKLVLFYGIINEPEL